MNVSEVMAERQTLINEIRGIDERLGELKTSPAKKPVIVGDLSPDKLLPVIVLLEIKDLSGRRKTANTRLMVLGAQIL